MKSVQIAVGGVAVLALLGGALPGGCSQIAEPDVVTDAATFATPLTSMTPDGALTKTVGSDTQEEPAMPAPEPQFAAKTVE